jgi:hypothetical protein
MCLDSQKNTASIIDLSHKKLGYIGIHQLIGGATHPFQKKKNKENSVIWYWELWIQPRLPSS